MTQAKAGKSASLYETDYVAWADQQALLLEQKRFNELDLVNLVEEVQDLSGRHRDALESHLSNLLTNLLKHHLTHLSKWHYESERRIKNWLISIRQARKEIARLQRKCPSLNVHLEAIFNECYLEAREVTSDDTGLALDVFPLECPYSVTQCLDRDFFPGDPKVISWRLKR